MSDIDYDDPMFERREYNPWIAYGQSKTANALFAVELDRRLRERGAAAYAVHPGMIMTELARHFTEETLQQMQELIAERTASQGTEPSAPPAMEFKSVESGAATQVWAATAAALADKGGAYLANCQIAEVGGDVAQAGVEGYAQDPASAARLWTLSEELVGESIFA